MADETRYVPVDEDRPGSARRQMTAEEAMVADRNQERQESGGEWDVIRQGINQFYDTQRDLSDQHVQTGLQGQLEQIQTQGGVQEAQDRFARAGAGNVGGTRRSTQQGLLRRALELQAGQATQGAQAQSSQNRMQIEAQRFEELASTFQDPFEQAATNAILQGIGVSSAAIQAQTQSQINLNNMYRQHQQEMGRFIGSGIANAGDAYHNSYLARR